MSPLPAFTDPVDKPLSRPQDAATLAERLMALPGFESAARIYCRSYLLGEPGDEPGRKLMHQHARYLTAFLLIRNYYAWRDSGGPPATLSLLKSLSGLSKRHTANLVSALRAGKLVGDEAVPGDRRGKALRPAPGLIYSVGRSPLCFAELADRLDPARAPRGLRLRQEADALGRLVRASGDYVAANQSILAAFPTILRMTELDCGYEVLLAVMEAHYDRNSGAETPPLSHQTLSRRFGISTSHAGNIVAALKRRELLELTPRGQFVALDPALAAEFHRWCAAQAAHTMLLFDGPLASQISR